MTDLQTISTVILGGALGSVVRYLTQELFAKHTALAGWIVIGAVNLSGCLLIGLLEGLLPIGSIDTPATVPMWTVLWVSFCGGLTTFSTFSLDNLLLGYHHRGQLAFNITGSLFGGWGMVLTGLFISRAVF